jgi:hypothetical protein
MCNRLNDVFSRSLAILAGAATAAVLASATLYATTYTNNGVTLTVPTYPANAPLMHCEPHLDATANTISLVGLPAGSSVRLNWILSSGVAGDPLTMIGQNFTNQDGTVSYTIPYPEDTADWPYQDATSRAIVVSVQVAVTTSTGSTVKIAAKGWKVVCVPKKPEEPTVKNGCTPGFWGRIAEPADQALPDWATAGLSIDQSYEAVFGIDATLDPPGPAPVIANPTLGQAVGMNGGGENALARHAVAALLNAMHPGVSYPMDPAAVITAVQNAYSTADDVSTPGNERAAAIEAVHHLFEGYNEIGCPLNRR